MEPAENIETPATPVTSVAKKQPPRRFAQRIFGTLILVGLAIYAAPYGIANTSVRQEVPKWLAPWFSGRIQLGATTLDWFSPVVVRDAEVIDREGRTLARITEFRTSRPLWQLVARPQELGTIMLDKVDCHLVVRQDGSTWDDILAEYYAVPPNGAATVVKVVLNETCVNWRRIDQPDDVPEARLGIAHIECESFAHGSVKANVEFANSQDGGAGQALKVGYAFQTDTSPRLQLDVDGQGWKLESLRPLLWRYGIDGQIAGTFDGKLQLVSSDDAFASGRMAAQCRLTDLDISQGDLWQGDRLRIPSSSVEGGVSWNPTELVGENLTISNDLAHVQWTGGIPSLYALRLPGNRNDAATGNAVPASVRDTTLSARVDIAAMTRQLPHLLKLHDGIVIERGHFEVSGAVRAVDGEPALHLVARMTEFSAKTLYGPETWETPFEFMLRATQQGEAWELQRTACRSEFLQAAAEPSEQGLRCVVQADLTKLAQRLSRYASLDGIQLAGQARIDADFENPAVDRARLHGQLAVNGWSLGRTAEGVWSERELTGDFDILAASATPNLSQIRSARVRLRADTDRARLDWNEPASAANGSPDVKFELVGDLDRWMRRGKFLAPQMPGRISGQAQLTGAVEQANDGVMSGQVSGTVQNLRVMSDSQAFTDPSVAISLDGQLKTATGAWNLSTLRVTGQSVTIEADGLSGGEAIPASLRGQIRAKGAIERLLAGLEPQVINSSASVSGPILAVAEFGKSPSTNASQQVGWSLESPGLVVQRQGANPVTVPLAVDGTVHLARDQQSIEKIDANWRTSGLSGSVTGKEQTDGVLNVQGDLTFAWEEFFASLGAALPGEIRLTGSGRESFSARIGPNGLVDGQGGLAWTGGQLAGLQLGASSLRLTANPSTIAVQPVWMPVNDGRIRVDGSLTRSPTGSTVSIPAGVLIDRVSLSEELCAGWVRYAAPFLADATAVQGQLSLETSGVMIPVASPTMAQTQGRLGIHSATAVPGPNSLRMLGVIDQVRNILKKDIGSGVSDRARISLPEQSVELAVAHGRIHHRQLQLQVGETLVTTRGSVGFDESLDLVLDIPLHGDWLPGGKIGQALSGKSLTVGVRGSVSQPQFDPVPLRDLTRQLTESAVERLIQKQLPSDLEKILPFRRQ